MMNKKSKDYELVRNFVFESEIELNNLLGEANLKSLSSVLY